MKKNDIKLLFVIGWPLGQGGHINSTLALVSDLLKNKQVSKIILLAPYGIKASLFKERGVEYIKLGDNKNNKIFALQSFFKILFYSIKYRTTVIHAMDYKALLPVILASIFSWRKVVFTKAGGTPLPFKLPKLNGLIVFSKELMAAYLNDDLFSDKENIYLIKERLSIEEFNSFNKSRNNKQKSTVFIAMRLMKAKKQLLDNLFYELSNISSLNKKILVTIAGDGELMTYCMKKAKAIENKTNNKVRFDFLGEINDKKVIFNYYKNSEIVVGHGRGIMEAMALEKCVVLFSFDKIGSVLVTKENIKNISDYNFSGRNISKKDENFSLSEIINLLDNDKIRLEGYEKFNKNYIESEYDSKIGANKTLDIYNKTGSYNLSQLFDNVKWLINKS